MPELIAMIQTSWTNIRVGLYRHGDGQLQYIEEGLQKDEEGQEYWCHYRESDLYKAHDMAAVRADMLEYYCFGVEDEYWVEPHSVTILEAPDFKGPHHPILKLGRPPQFE